MTYLVHGAMVEYGTDFLGPLPNVVVFQFNPESITRTIEIPPRPTGSSARETTQAGDAPVERFSIKAEFDASDHLNSAVDVSMARAFGVGPQLAALEKMARPTAFAFSGLIGAAVDVVASLIAANGQPPFQLIPREVYPRLLFIWGPRRIVPVIIESMSIGELQYDSVLNPTRAEVTIGLAINPPAGCSLDLVARGAMLATSTIKDGEAVLNQAISARAGAQAIVELITF